MHHKALPIPREIVIGLPKFNIEQHGVFIGCTLGKNDKDSFPSSEASNNYMIFIPNKRKITTRRDANFEEEFTSRKSHDPIPLIEDEE